MALLQSYRLSRVGIFGGEAADGEQAIAMAQSLRPDLVLVDVSMPGLNGLEVARRLRQDLPQSRILIMSQHDPVQLLPRAREAGANSRLRRQK